MSITYQTENPYDIQDELLPLNEEHYKGDFREEEATLSIDWEKYKQGYEEGTLTCFTARDGDVLVGYMTSIISPHHQVMNCLMGAMDTLFVSPEYRSIGVASELFKATEDFLKECGVDYYQATFRTEQTAEAVTGKFGYKKVEYTYGKSLRNK